MRVYCIVRPHYNDGVSLPASEPDAPQYRIVHAAADEGEAFLDELGRVADFYVRVMGGRVRHDAPGVRLKWSRDWEYPWILTRAKIGAGSRVLDCGAGNSPVPYLMAARGASVIAVDRDALVASRGRYAWLVLCDWARSLAGRPLRLTGASAAHQSPDGLSAAGAQPARPRRPLPVRAWRFLRFNLVKKHAVAFSRIWKPDVWGPVSPRLLRRFGVDYRHGDLTALSFPAGSFDVVSCISVLEHMPPETRAKGVREMARVLKPGGQLLLTYDLQEKDLTNELVEACGLIPVELARLDGVVTTAGRRCPDAIGVSLIKPLTTAADAAGSSSSA